MKKKKVDKSKSFLNQYTSEIEVLDFDEPIKYETKTNKKKMKLKFHFPIKDISFKKFTIKNKWKFAGTCVASLAVLLLVISMVTGTNVFKAGVNKILALAGIYREEIRSVEIKSPDYDDQGSWHIDKSAEWTGNGKARVTFDVHSAMKTGDNYKDVILVLDISGSMSGEKMTKMVSDAKELVSYLLSDTHNKVAIITFDSTSTIVSTFSNTKDELLNKLDALTVTGCTDYNAALKNVDIVMDGYQKKNNRDVVTLFLTDGYPNEDTPNQIGTYEMLKDKYPYMAINGVQYEMGSNIIEEIKQITDSQWVADQSTLNNVLFDASISPMVYEDFIVTDYIHDDYFEIASVEDIKVTMGTVTLEMENGVQKITWNLGKNSFMTGGSAKMYINLTLKQQYVGSEGYYPTNQKESVTSKLSEENQKKVDSTNTPVLKNYYEVKYDTNAPEECELDSIDSENHFIYQNVTKRNDNLSCQGYIFKGWEMDEEDAKDVTNINDDVFVMPGHDVTLRATWTKQSIDKSMEGTVYEAMTLYKVLENAAKDGVYAKEYNGEHQDSMDGSGKEKIYYYYESNSTNGTAILDMNNVIFAGQCWQMIRTTDTGGVKMIYNGEAENNQCLNTRGTHVGYASRTSTSLNSNYWYGTSYEYDSTTKMFSLSGNTEQATWSTTTGADLIGKYTCKSSDINETCATLYLIESEYNATSAYVIPLNSSSNYSRFGTLQFNTNSNSPAYVGYMYGDVYNYSEYSNSTLTQSFTSIQTVLTRTIFTTSYKYSKDINYTGSSYSLVEPIVLGSAIEEDNYEGYYTYRSAYTTSGASPYYLLKYDTGTYYYAVQLSSSKQLNDFSMMIGNSIKDNGDGTYTVENTTLVTPEDWYNTYADYKNKYTCGDSTTKCNNPRYLTATTVTNYTYVNAGEKIMIAKDYDDLTLTDTLLVRKDELISNSSNYSDYKYTCNTESNVCSNTSLRYIASYSTTGYTYAKNHYWGSSVTWDGENYTLVDPIGLENYNNNSNLSTHHYMCVADGLKSCSTVAYVYYNSESTYYITLSNGDMDIDTALEKMFTKNKTNSTMKIGVDAWYKKYLLDYDNYLEDTIFCNDRSQINASTNGWNPNGGSLTTYMYFNNFNTITDLSCSNVTDQFSVNNPLAQLKYKVGLMSAPEMNTLQSNARETGQSYWLASPRSFSDGNAFGRVVYKNGRMDYYSVYDTYGVRPAVSLATGTEYSKGDGSMRNPYYVEIVE